MRPKLLVILGPTATGKSDLAVRLALKIAAQKLGGYKGAEIISADSRQVYKGLDIGTGKITRKEMRGIRHHLLDVARAGAPSSKRFTVQKYRELADAAIADIMNRGKLPIICGGTGFYIDTVVNGTEFSAVKADHKLRAGLSKKTPVQLLAMLKKLDYKRWQIINGNPSDKKNARRLIRAIEIAQALKEQGKNMERRPHSDPSSAGRLTDDNGWTSTPPLRDDYDTIFIGLRMPISELRQRIHSRLLKRLQSGMVVEALRLHAPRSARNPNGGLSWKRMDELGLEYRYLSRYLYGIITKEEMLEKLNVEIGRYAKRQMTWFKRNKEIRWFRPEDKEKVDKTIIKALKR